MKPTTRKKSRTDQPTLPELDQAKRSVLNSLPSLQSRRSYEHAMDEFIEWYCSEPRLALNLGVATISVRLAVVRRLACEAADDGLLSPELVAKIRRVKGVLQFGRRVGKLAQRRLRKAVAVRIQRSDTSRETRRLGHASVQTTERYIGCKENLSCPATDRPPFASGWA